MPARGKLTLRDWDHGLVAQEIIRNSLIPRKLVGKEVDAAHGLIVPSTKPENKVQEATFSGTTKILTEVYSRIEDRFASYFDVAGFEPSIPQTDDREEKTKFYKWSKQWDWTKEHQDRTADKYPPHLSLIPWGDSNWQVQIFDFMRLLDTGFVVEQIIPASIKDFIYSHPDRGASMADIEKRNETLRAEKKNILDEPNIGDLKKLRWFTDEVFAQQQFTGTNPVTITKASSDWVKAFTQAAKDQQLDQYIKLIGSADKAASLYVQDCSWYRKALGVALDAELKANKAAKDQPRYANCAVTLFNLTDEGKLHPLAIIIDWKGSIDKSVTIFNKRTTPTEQRSFWWSRQDHDQEHDWPWRYAKSVAQSSDWTQHELVVHLTNCHFVEEATIVASKRALSNDHLVYRCLQPHWLKTLSLNASARSSLVPFVIVPLVGFTEDQTYQLVTDAYARFDWQANYVPNDLERRGFPIKEVRDSSNAKFHNYAYGKMALLLWQVIRKFVRAFLANGGQGNCLDTDDKVAADGDIARWCEEMRRPEGGQMTSWPVIKTVDQLVDAVTMCIWIASGLHTAVNYLQEYYQSFVVNRAPAVCAPMPRTLKELEGFKEADLMASLPINRAEEWLLASHLVHLLNYKVASDQNLVNYARSLYHMTGNPGSNEPFLQAAAKDLFNDLMILGDATDAQGNKKPGVFTDISKGLDNQELPYHVLEPAEMAVSILI